MSDLTDRIASDVSGIFARTSDFGTEASFVFGDLSRSINVIFEEYYSGHDVYGNEVTNTGPVAFCATSDIENAEGLAPGEDETDRATLEVNTVLYKITKCARGGETSMLTLSRD